MAGTSNIKIFLFYVNSYSKTSLTSDREAIQMSAAVSIQFISRIPKSNIWSMVIFLWSNRFRFRYLGPDILGILDFYTISKPKINLKHTFHDNLCLKNIYRTLISKTSKCLNRKVKNHQNRIERSK